MKELKSQLIIFLLIFCLHLDNYKRKIKEMQFKCWWLTLALLLIQFLKKFLCIEPITITIGAVAAGASTLACKNLFFFFCSVCVSCAHRFSNNIPENSWHYSLVWSEFELCSSIFSHIQEEYRELQLIQVNFCIQFMYRKISRKNRKKLVV